MDYKRALNELYQARQQLSEVIKNLESLRQGKQPCPRRNVKLRPSGCETTGHLDDTSKPKGLATKKVAERYRRLVPFTSEQFFGGDYAAMGRTALY
jgi:hypothetical protein